MNDRIKKIRFIESLLIHFGILKSEFKKAHNRTNILIPNYEIHRNGMSAVINSNMVLTVKEEGDIVTYIRNYYQQLVRFVCKHGKSMSKRYDFERLLPLGFARISVYSKLMRKRTYKNYGLGKDLICVIQYKKLQRICCPNIFGSTVEEHGLYRIEWNKKWLIIHN